MNRQDFYSRFGLQLRVKPCHWTEANNLSIPSAVLVPLQIKNNKLELILTKRTLKLKAHPGQISFPGGKQEPQDQNAQSTALREAKEEIGLHNHQVEILGHYSSFATLTGFTITPIIALVNEDFKPEINTHEVANCFSVPFSFLTQPQNRQYQIFSRRGQIQQMCFIPWGNELIWGATAAIIDDLCRHISGN